MSPQEIKLILSNNPPFNKLSSQQIDRLIAISQVKEYHNSEIIYRQKSSPDYLYFLLKGRVMVLVSGDNKDCEIEIIKRGTCFGIISLLTNEPHSVTAKSIETSFIMRVADSDFRTFLNDNPYLALDFSCMLSQRVKGRSKPKRIFQSKKIGIIGEAAAGKTTFMFNLAQQLIEQTRKKVICVQIGSNKSLQPNQNSLRLSDFSEKTLSDYIEKGAVDRLSLIATAGGNFLALFNFLSENYHFILYEIANKFSESELSLFIDPAHQLEYIIFPKKGALKQASFLIGNLIERNPINREKIKVILAEFPVADRLSFIKKRNLLNHPISAILPSSDSQDYNQTLKRLARQIGEVSLGLALGSGAAYGYAHIGVLKVLEESRIPIDLICGSSMGAVIAALWAAGFSISEIKSYSKEVGKKIGSFSILGLSIPLRGIMKAKRLEGTFRRIFKDLTFYDLKHTLKIVSFDFKKRRAIVIEEGLVYKALAASCAFPGIFEPIRLKQDILLDGGVLNPLPTKVLLQYDIHKIIASNITLSQAQARSEYARRKSFNIFDFIFGSIETMQQQFIQQAVKLADLVIHPNLEGLGWTEFDKIEEFIIRGESAMREKLKEVKKLIVS